MTDPRDVAAAAIAKARRAGCVCDDPTATVHLFGLDDWQALISHSDWCPLAHPQTAGPLAGSPSAGASGPDFVDDRLEGDTP